MSDELKPCPNRKCRNDRVVTASRVLDAAGLSQAFGECPMCGARGPMVAGATMVDAVVKAREAWDELPRDDAPKPLRWTSEPPRVPGWYWLRAHPDAVSSIGCLTSYHVRLYSQPGKYMGQSAGPIPEPIDADEPDAPTLRDEVAAVLADMDKAASEMVDQGMFQPWRERLRAALAEGGGA